VAKVDEHSPTVVLGTRERAALERLLASEPDVVGAYLFGSQARGQAGPLSDVDVAVWLDPGLPAPARGRRQLELMSRTSDALGTDEVQVVVMNDAPPLLAQRVLRDGVLLAERDPALRVRLETDAIVRYLDTSPLREELGRQLERRLSEGTFGRPSGG